MTYVPSVYYSPYLSGGFWLREVVGKTLKNSSYVQKTRIKRKQERERKKGSGGGEVWWGRKPKFPMGSHYARSNHIHCSLLKKKKKKKMSGHEAGKTMQRSHVTVLMRCHLFPSKSCCNMITPLRIRHFSVYEIIECRPYSPFHNLNRMLI